MAEQAFRYNDRATKGDPLNDADRFALIRIVDLRERLTFQIRHFGKGNVNLMAIYTGYFDESGDEQQESFVLGGLVLDANRIAEFDFDWAEALKDLPPKNGKPYFHTTDFVSGNDIYEPVWKGRYNEKLAILTGLAKVIARYSFQTFSAVLFMNEFATLDASIKFGEVAGHPYAMACRIGEQQLRYWANANSILTPIKMIVEERHGMGEVHELFAKDRLAPPSVESKATPALQAADYIAWMRLRKRHPTLPYRQVKESWREVPSYLHTDQMFGISDFVTIARNIIDANEGKLLPARDDPNHLVTFNNSPDRIRTPFKRKPKTPSD